MGVWGTVLNNITKFNISGLHLSSFPFKMTLSQNESAQSTSHVDLAMVYMKRFMVWIKINNSLLESIQIVILLFM